ncbi:hypothetical protein ZEAMMB73_Zm00001d007253 [Zea mays]|uniref:Uncharacterized protein n=1 Tax=Zea mays TaxID=4577 RepID=A0A1D6F539_MAIZE|nr:hypothetical protein ZEAMMB73_Zm00001d007253 [Zea mays]
MTARRVLAPHRRLLCLMRAQPPGPAGIFDATNNTRKRIYMLMKMAEDNCKAKKDEKKQKAEGNILLASIENMQYVVTIDVLHEYLDIQTSFAAKEALEGHIIYEGGGIDQPSFREAGHIDQPSFREVGHDLYNMPIKWL